MCTQEVYQAFPPPLICLYLRQLPVDKFTCLGLERMEYLANILNDKSFFRRLRKTSKTCMPNLLGYITF